VRRWWDDGVRTPYPRAELDGYREALRGDDPTYHYIASLDDRPIGLFQHYRIADHAEYAHALALEDDAVGVDLFIGESDLIGRGIGPTALREFLRRVAMPFHRLAVCVIGPSVTNVAAIRAYEKAGFTKLRVARVPGQLEPEQLMRMTKMELDSPPPGAPKSDVDSVH
jgi:RimJ/RimL family protein N-acetyltransferase